MRLRFTHEAQSDLNEIWEYIALDNPTVAVEFTNLIKRKCYILVDNPCLGREREELASSLRSIPVGNYIIFYRSKDDEVQIIRILHGSRDIDSLF